MQARLTGALLLLANLLPGQVVNLGGAAVPYGGVYGWSVGPAHAGQAWYLSNWANPYVGPFPGNFILVGLSDPAMPLCDYGLGPAVLHSSAEVIQLGFVFQMQVPAAALGLDIYVQGGSFALNLILAPACPLVPGLAWLLLDGYQVTVQ